MKKISAVVLMVLLSSVYAGAQETKFYQSHGPRMGISWVLSDGSYGADYGNFVTTVFGYHVDTTVESGSEIMPVIQFDGLVGGLERGHVLPTLSTVFGVRGAGGAEGGAGPTLSVGGTGVVFALGYTFQSGTVSYPLNLAAAFSESSTRISLISGFNFAK